MWIFVAGDVDAGKKRAFSARLAARLGLRMIEEAALSTSRRPSAEADGAVVASSDALASERGGLAEQHATCRVELTRADSRSDSAARAARGSEREDPIHVSAELPEIEGTEHVAMQLARRGFYGNGRVHIAEGGRNHVIDGRRAAELVDDLLTKLGPLERVLLVPPDFTRFHSGAGELASLLYARLCERATVEVLPALGTHAPMSAREIAEMFPGIPAACFRIHEWRSGLHTLGEVPASFVREVSSGRLDYAIPCEVDAHLVDGRWDRIISIGQLVPHEVIGIAGHDKNIFVGTGGKTVIDRTHFLGAVCGMESVMGRAHSPVRAVLAYMAGTFGRKLPITHLLTVRERGADGALVTRGLFSGDDAACFAAGAPLVQQCNLELFDDALEKVVVYLDPNEFKSTWLGNKSIYRTRMALADDAELLVLAPGVARFGEDPDIDRLIRRHGYHGTEATLAAVERDPELAASLSAAAHLIHGSSEGRFRIAYATAGLSAETVSAAGYEPRDLAQSLSRYAPERLKPGFNRLPDGEQIFFVPNPALGLWGLRRQFSS